jgi:taurine dioxygenase
MKIHPTGQFDNHAREYRRITAQPLSAAMGAEITGVQINGVDDESFGEITDALYRHKMIYFPDQEMGHEDQENFTQRFGDFGADAYTPGVEGHRDIQSVLKEADNRAPMIFGGAWHTDSPFLPRPPAISMLFGDDIPPFGGDTIWANSALAYSFLSDAMKAVLAPLKVHMSAADALAAVRQDSGDGMGRIGSVKLSVDAEPMIAGSYHPLVRTHPETGEKALYVDDTYALGIEGMTEREASSLLTFLCEHITQPAFTCRLRWEPNTFAIWDNRICLHHAFNDHDGYRRQMFRTTVLGEVPV